MEMASHEPAHPIQEEVKFSAKATGNVDRIDLWVTEFRILPDMTPGPVVIERSKIKSCNPTAWTSSLTCTASKTFSDEPRLIKYEARAHAPGTTERSEAYLFASGKLDSLVPVVEQLEDTGESREEDNHPKFPIPIRVNDFGTKEYLDVVMIPDSDLPDPNLGETDPAEVLRKNLNQIISLYFKYQHIRKARGLINFFYSPWQGDYEEPGEDCKWNGPDNLSVLSDRADIVLYLHREPKLDCTSGGKVSSEIDNEKSLVHESGHGLFNLSDEYEIEDGSYYRINGQQACMRNVWLSNLPQGISGRENCRADVPDGLAPSDCVDIVPPGNVWRVDPAKEDLNVGCIMGELQHSGFSDFGPACLRRINWIYENCLAGDCMAECPEESN